MPSSITALLLSTLGSRTRGSDRLPCGGGDAIRGKAEMLHHHLDRRGHTECVHAQNDTCVAHVTLPAQRRAFLNGHARPHSRRQYRVAIGRILFLE